MSPGGQPATDNPNVSDWETIEETAGALDTLGGKGIAVRVDHIISDEVRYLVESIRKE